MLRSRWTVLVMALSLSVLASGLPRVTATTSAGGMPGSGSSGARAAWAAVEARLHVVAAPRPGSWAGPGVPEVPSLRYSTYLGGAGYDGASSIAVDGAGNAYVTGFTTSPNFPTLHALQARYGGGSTDAFVAKISPGGQLLYSTYLGGTHADWGLDIAVDSGGNAYVTGMTLSPDFPTFRALQPHLGVGGGHDAFVAKLSPSGQLLYSTYLGGKDEDQGWGIAVDSAGDAYVTGFTNSPDFPTRHALQTLPGGSWDAFVAKLGPSGQLLYSTYLGGKLEDQGYGIAVGRAGNVYVTGLTRSPDFPTRHAVQARYAGGSRYDNGGVPVGDAFVVRLSPGGRLIFSTYLGGTGDDAGLGIAVDSIGGAYVTGDTRSPDFPTRHAVQTRYAGGGHHGGVLKGDAFVARLGPTGQLLYSTYLGGSSDDDVGRIAVDGSGNAYVTGVTASPNFPTRNALQARLEGGNDAFVTSLSPNGQLVYSTYLGGSGGDGGSGIAMDSAGNVYVAGGTGSPDFPTRNALQARFGGAYDAFVAILSAGQ